MKLTKRMKAIVSMCEPVDTIVDVGCDHGKVAIAIANLKISNHVIATDIREFPLEACKLNANKYLIKDATDFKTIKCDGISLIDKNIECGIIISGMGYDLICKILENIDEYNFKYLLLSPHTKIVELIKKFDNKYKISQIKTVFEDDKAYFILKIK